MLIETNRLVLRPIELSDAPAVLKYSVDSQVTRYTGDAGTVTTLSDARNLITNVWHSDYQKYGYGRLALVVKESNQVIGFCGLKYLEDLEKTDLGYRMLPEYWGRGYATESSLAVLEYAKKSMELDEIIGMAAINNVASQNVLLKLGFREVDELVIKGLLVKLFNLRLRD